MPLHSLEDMVSDAYTEAWLDGPQSTKFYTRTYLAPPSESKAVLVFIHGFAEHVGRYTEAHPQFAARGINVFTFDQRGFGKTALDTKNKSKSSVYGKTSGEQQLDDVQWAIDHAKKEFPGLPVFLSGHSMGGGEVLNFPLRRDAAGLAGIIASSPLVHQTKPASKIARAAGGLAAGVVPYFTIPAPLDYNVSLSCEVTKSQQTENAQELSHDDSYNKMCSKDPLSKLQGSLRGISDMLNWGEELLRINYKKWPNTLPILFVHGTGDQITSYTSVKEFHDKIVADDKSIILYDDGFHELVHEPAHREKLLNDEIAWMQAHLPETEPPESKL
ncbi:Hydrolase-4 domain-containing protein [Mycena sanguinolenta]|uniref:Hydrolase-4 domain-containing protein n=1 Tax=Mycena sanguinolenta TaxID=230812 RepID=A0A8H6Y306_9AGAR|nr:Hydrolase-4 domain-containing protein [Mycena sanguinolenta]